jgi:hypothetical protein
LATCPTAILKRINADVENVLPRACQPGDLNHSEGPPAIADLQFDDFLGTLAANRPVNWAIGGGLGEIAGI